MEKQNVVHMASVSFAAEVESKSEWCKMGGKNLEYMVKAAKYFLWI